MLRCPADQPGVELGASDLARRGKASVARRNSTANGYIAQWQISTSLVQIQVCPLCFHDGLSLQGLRLMLIQRVQEMEWG